jgi:phage tail-like protein
MAVGDRIDPYRGFNFRVEIDNNAVAAFSEVSGLSFDIEPVEYREGNELQLHPRKVPGLRKFGNITLKRGYTDNTDLFEWYRTTLNGSVDRRDGAIILRDEDHNDVLRWNFSNGWVTKYEGPTFNATSNDVVIESVELAVERVELA